MPNLFNRALGHVCGAVLATFDSDAQLKEWIVAMTATSADPTRFESSLTALAQRLRTGWISSMLTNEHRSEESGVIHEAICSAVKVPAAARLSRDDFSYVLTDKIMNTGIRRLNQSAHGLHIPTSDVALLHESVDPNSVTADDLERILKALEEMLRARRDPADKDQEKEDEVLLKILRQWRQAIEAVESEHPDHDPRASSAQVIIKLSELSGLPVKAIQAAIKRLKRAVRKMNYDKLS